MTIRYSQLEPLRIPAGSDIPRDIFDFEPSPKELNAGVDLKFWETDDTAHFLAVPTKDQAKEPYHALYTSGFPDGAEIRPKTHLYLRIELSV